MPLCDVVYVKLRQWFGARAMLCCYDMSSPRIIRSLLLAAAVLAAPSASGAQTITDCFTGVEVTPRAPAEHDLLVVTIEGLVDYCASIRVAAVGDAQVLGVPPPPPFQAPTEVTLVIAQRPGVLPPGVSCPAVEVPFVLTVGLPQPLPAGNRSVGLFRRFEDSSGQLASLQSCGVIQLAVAPGYRSAAALHGERFKVEVTWSDGQGNEGSGFVVPGADGGAVLGVRVGDLDDPPRVDANAASALFWFFGPANWELMVKVLDGCAVNGHWWVLGAAATDVEYTVRVTDTVTGEEWQRHHPQGILAPAFADVGALGGCPAPAGAARP
jgi:hypothetical protein